jgi:hypothetical protein
VRQLLDLLHIDVKALRLALPGVSEIVLGTRGHEDAPLAESICAVEVQRGLHRLHEGVLGRVRLVHIRCGGVDCGVLRGALGFFENLFGRSSDGQIRLSYSSTEVRAAKIGEIILKSECLAP